MQPNNSAAALGEKLSELCFRLGTVFADWARSLERDIDAPPHTLLHVLNDALAPPPHPREPPASTPFQPAAAGPRPAHTAQTPARRDRATDSACAASGASAGAADAHTCARAAPDFSISKLVASVTNSITDHTGLAATPSPRPPPTQPPVPGHDLCGRAALAAGGKDGVRRVTSTHVPPSPLSAARLPTLPASRSQLPESVDGAVRAAATMVTVQVGTKRTRADSDCEPDALGGDQGDAVGPGAESAQGALLRGSSKRPRMAWTMDETTRLFDTVDRVPHGSENEVAHAVAVALGGSRTFAQCKARMRALRTAGFIACNRVGPHGAGGTGGAGGEAWREGADGAMKWCVLRRAKKRVRLNWTAGERETVRETIARHASADRDELVNLIAQRLGGDRTSYQVRRHLDGLVKTGKVRYCESSRRRWVLNDEGDCE